MRNILEELWYGNVCPSDECRETTKEAKELMELIARHHDNLQATLTKKQKKHLKSSMIATPSYRTSTSVKLSYMRFGSERGSLLRL